MCTECSGFLRLSRKNSLRRQKRLFFVPGNSVLLLLSYKVVKKQNKIKFALIFPLSVSEEFLATFPNNRKTQTQWGSDDIAAKPYCDSRGAGRITQNNCGGEQGELCSPRLSHATSIPLSGSSATKYSQCRCPQMLFFCPQCCQHWVHRTGKQVGRFVTAPQRGKSMFYHLRVLHLVT